MLIEREYDLNHTRIDSFRKLQIFSDYSYFILVFHFTSAIEFTTICVVSFYFIWIAS